MGYVADRPLEEAFPDIVEGVARRTVERVDERFRDELERRTPVASLPPAYLAQGGGMAGWIRDRRGRRPGTARASWKSTGPVQKRDGWTVTAWSDDPAMIHIEHDTRPHLIRPKRAGGVLRFPMGLRFLFRRYVHHPGTQGHHMMRDTLAQLEAEWPAICEAAMEEEAARD